MFIEERPAHQKRPRGKKGEKQREKSEREKRRQPKKNEIQGGLNREAASPPKKDWEGK